MNNLKYTLIKNQEQYDKYCNRLEAIVEKDAEKHIDEIELLSLLISDYNDRIMNQFHYNMNPVELLEDLILDNKLTQIAVAKKLDISPQLLNDVLKYRREITKKLALKLSTEFNLKYSAFLKPYKLKKAS
jgi:HTH-type transcriptional regulator/antitoxin HigA